MKTLIVVLALTLLGGCAGRQAAPVSMDQIGDQRLTCEEILSEMETIELHIARLFPETQKTSNRIGWGAAGIIFPPLWLFMDLSEAERIEIRAYEARMNRLGRLANKKNCDF